MKDKATLKWLWRKARPQTAGIIAVSVASMIMASTSVLLALAAKRLIDSAVSLSGQNGGAALRELIFSASLILGVIILQLALRLLGQGMQDRIQARLNILFRKSLFSAILQKEYRAVTGFHSGDLMTRLQSDIAIISGAVTTMVPSLLNMITRLICAFTVLVIMDKSFALVFLVGGVGVFIVTRAFRGIMKRLHKRVQETESDARSFMQETTENILAVKAFSVEKKVAAKADVLQELNFKARMKQRNLGILANAGFGFVFQMGYFYAMVWGAWGLFHATITYGTLMAIIQLVGQVQSPFAGLSGMLPQYYAMLASSERIMEIENMEDETADTDIPYIQAPDEIDFDGVTFAYVSKQDMLEPVLDDISLHIKSGDFIAISGISGVGKSTMLKLLLGVYTDYTGNITLRFGGDKVNAGKSTRSLFAYVPQGNFLFSGTIKENITFIRDDVTDEDINNVLRISCADSFVDTLPVGLSTMIGEKGLGLSEGQAQRLAIARALLVGAPVLLLDEATSALDEATEARLLTNLKQLKNLTCMIVSHKRAAIEICGRHIRIENGRIRD